MPYWFSRDPSWENQHTSREKQDGSFVRNETGGGNLHFEQNCSSTCQECLLGKSCCAHCFALKIQVVLLFQLVQTLAVLHSGQQSDTCSEGEYQPYTWWFLVRPRFVQRTYCVHLPSFSSNLGQVNSWLAGFVASSLENLEGEFVSRVQDNTMLSMWSKKWTLCHSFCWWGVWL